MADLIDKPWATGPAEILQHGFELLRKDTDRNRRLAMLSIDNAVELMMKTCLGLPGRITGLRIPRREFNEMSENFGMLLDGIEKYAAGKIIGINLGEIEFYHRIRNELYHQGNGLTVERTKVYMYSELADILFASLFGVQVTPTHEEGPQLLSRFMNAWIGLEKALGGKRADRLGAEHGPQIARQVSELRAIRNRVVHGEVEPEEAITQKVIDSVIKLTTMLT